MDLLIDKLTSSLVQIIAFSLIPLIWWALTARKTSSFVQWIGLKRLNNVKEHQTLLWSFGLLIGFLIVSLLMLWIVQDIETAASEFAGMGIAALPAILVYAFLNTSLPEEILFRGFLLKRVSARWGFSIGNLLQAVLFGLLHGVLFVAAAGFVKAVLISVFTGGIAYCMGYVNEKKANGSILPSWIIHALSNVFSGLWAAFLIVS